MFKWWPRRFLRAKHIDRTLEAVIEELNAIGPVDALLGFSQGATLVELLDSRVEDGYIRKTWNFSILISGAPLKSMFLPAKYTANRSTELDVPAIHIRGVLERKTLMNSLLDRYVVGKRELLEHAKGHEIPNSKEFARSLAEKIIRMSYNERRRNLCLADQNGKRDIVSSVVKF
jgi:hypothetical protein